ncbi:flagellar export protein FliJ [Guyparkeria sp. GHLCS8-2]|uniref:flagellar export protein FliJ n=1 Tax=Guyparkeria halopsychrophila TaxID=3139421 RepID=UPI0037CA484E
MSDTQRLKSLGNAGRVMGHQADLASRRRREAQRELDAQRQRLADLEGYFTEYTNNLGFAAEGRNRAFALQNYRQFMARIEETIEHQRKVVHDLEGQLSKRANDARDAHARNESVDRLSQRYRDSIRRRDDRTEQQVMDQHGAAKVAHGGGTGGMQ